MRFYSAVALCLLTGVQTIAQNFPSDTSPEKLAYLKGKWFAKLNIISLIDDKTPVVHTGIEHRFNKRLAAEFNIGIPVRIGSASNTDSTSNNYYKLKAEVKYFPWNGLFYFSSELFYTHRKTVERDGRFQAKDGTYYRFAAGDLERNIGGLAFKIGRAFPISSRLHLDGFIGPGFRLIHLKVNATSLQKIRSYENILGPKEGTSYGPHFTAGLKLSYRIY